MFRIVVLLSTCIAVSFATLSPPGAHAAWHQLSRTSTSGLLSLSPTSGPPGTSVQVKGNIGTACRCRSAVLYWDGRTIVGSAGVSASGMVAGSFTAPPSTTGSHTISVVTGSFTAAQTTFVVTGSSATPTPTTVPTATPTSVPTASPTPTSTVVPPTPSVPQPPPTATPTATQTPVPTSTQTPVPTATQTPVPTATQTPVPTSTSIAVSSAFGPPSTGAYLGVWQAGLPTNLSALSTFEQQAGRRVAIAMFWRDWAADDGTIDPAWLSAIAAQGAIPMITWSPADWSNSADNANYTLANITAGKFDTYIRQTADILKAYNAPVLLRTMHEFNGNWYHWSGNPTAYVAAWRHIHDIFTQEGATNVQWVWCPNTFWPGSLSTDPGAYYPGPTYVDWVGLDGYNRSDWGYMSFTKIFSYAVNDLTQYGKPLMIAETASGEFNDGGVKKAQWITDAFTNAIPALPAIKAVLWFNEDKSVAENCPCQWPTNSTTVAQQAYTSAVANSYYVSSPQP